MRERPDEGIHLEQYPPHDPVLDRMERGGTWRGRLRFIVPMAVAGGLIAAVLFVPPAAISLLSGDSITKDMMAKLDDGKPLLPNEKRLGPTETVADLVPVRNYLDPSQVLGLIPRGTKIGDSIYQGSSTSQGNRILAYCSTFPGLDPKHARKLCAVDYEAVALTSPDSLVAPEPEPVGVYNGSLQITKQVNGEFVNIRTAPTTLAENTKPWDNIFSLEDTGVRNINVFSVQNPWFVKGNNPTFDPGRSPSMWVRFRAKVLVSEYPPTVEEMWLYLNISQQTILRGHVQPDTPDWYENITPFEAASQIPHSSIVTALPETSGKG